MSGAAPSWVQVAIAALGVAQTIALAILAARQHRAASVARDLHDSVEERVGVVVRDALNGSADKSARSHD